jgi:hypothetical protein
MVVILGTDWFFYRSSVIGMVSLARTNQQLIIFPDGCHYGSLVAGRHTLIICLGGSKANLPFEMKGDNKQELLKVSNELHDLAKTKVGLLADISSIEAQFFQKNQEKQIVETEYEKISRESSVYNALGETINNFKSTLNLNPSLAAIIKPQIESRKEERIKLITTIFQRRNNPSTSRFDPLAARKDIEELELTLATLKKTLTENPAISAIIKPQITKKTNEIEVIKERLIKNPINNDFKLSSEQEIELLKELRIEVDDKKRILDQINKELSKISLKIENVRKQIAQVESDESVKIKRNNQLTGKSDTELVETNSTLRLVYKRLLGDNGIGRLVDSLPNEVPLYRDRNVYTLGVESLLAYYGLSESNVVISEDNSRFMINDRDGNTIIDSPLSDGQFLEVNWFSRWSEKSAEKSLVMSAKRAYGEKDFALYLSLIPSVFESFLSKVNGFQLPDSIDDYAKAMKELDLGEKQLAIAEKTLTFEGGGSL